MDPTSQAVVTPPTAGRAEGQPPAAWPVQAITPWAIAPAIAVVALLLAVAGRYGFHRDELYFIESMRHPAWGYVDNPALTPALGWVSRQLFGDSLVGLRVVPALEVGVLVLVVALLARELGARRGAQVLAAAVAATASFHLAIGHLLTTPTVDVLATAVVLLGLCRIVRTGDQRWWLAIGLVVGIGLQNKYTLALVLVALGGAALLSGCWRRLVSWWLVLGALLALVVWAPQLWWQVTNGWPQVEFARALAEQEGGENRALLIPFQFLVVGPPLAPLVLAGLWSLWRRPTWRPVRFLALGYVLMLVLLLVSGGKGYYSAGLFAALIAAGSVATADWTDRGSRTVRRALVGVALAVNLAVGAIITLPLLPSTSLDGPISELNEDAAETVGWPGFVEQLADAAPAQDRAGLVVLAADYGAAGAIDRFGAARGLPPAHSPHNSYADFRTPNGSSGPVLVVGYARDTVDRWFDGCSRLTTIRTVDGIDNEADGTPVWRCERPAQAWDRIWPELRRYG